MGECEEEIIRRIIAQQNNKLDEMIKAALADKGYIFKSIFELKPFAKKYCRVEIRDKIHTLFARDEGICQWSFCENPIEISKENFSISITTNFYFKKL